MKQVSLLLLASVFILASCKKEKVVSEDKLPSTSNTYITTHFPDQKIVQIVKDIDNLTTTFEVYLDNGVKLEFSKSGEILEINGNDKLPDSVIPTPILEYVTTHYPDQFIKSWDKDTTNQDVKLSNGLTLEFDLNGVFLRIDD